MTDTPRQAGEAETCSAEQLLHELRVHQIELETQNESLRQAQAELEASRDRYVELYEFAPVGYLGLDEDGTITEANLTASALLGTERGRMLGRRFAGMVAPEDGAAWARLFARMARQGEKVAAELSLRRADSGFFQARINGLPLTSADNTAGLRLTLTDISREKAAEWDLEESRERYHLIFEHSNEAIFLTDPESGRFLDISRAALASTGYTRAEMLAMRVTDLEAMLPDQAAWEAHIATLKAAGAIIMEGLHRRKDGNTFPVEVTLKHYTHGERAYLLAMARDISERKRAEASLRASEANLNALLDNSPALMWLKDIESRFIAVNQTFVRSAGKTSTAEIVGKTDFDLWPAELARRYRDEDIEVMRGRRQLTIECQELHLGRPCWMETHKTPVLDLHGTLLGTAGFSRDISEHRKRERAAAEQRNTLVREVHHRIKNNLQSVAGLLQRQLGAHSELAWALRAALTQVNAIAVVHGLQSLGDVEAPRFCDTAAQICKLVGDLTQRALDWRVADSANHFGPVRIDRDEAVPVALIVNELVLNAVKHSPPDADAVRVDLYADGVSARLLIRNIMLAPGPGFDFAQGTGLNTGLRLVRSLLPERGLELRYYSDGDGWLNTEVVLSEPVVRLIGP